MEQISLEKLTLHNFGVYKDEVLDFTGKDIVGILAEYAKASQRSNRAGKSLIIESIKYNLIGKHRYGKANQMIHRGEKEMFVEAIYRDSNGQEYNIKRGVDYKGKGLLQLNWADKSREAQEAIEDLFGISKDDFELTTFFQQQDINGFMDLSASKKSEHVMKWMNNTHWTEKESLVKEDVKVLKDKIKDNDTITKALKSGLELEENLETEKDALEIRIETVSKQIAEQKKIVSKAEAKFNKLKNDRKGAKGDIQELKDKIRSIELAQSNLNKKKQKAKLLSEEIKQGQRALKAGEKSLPKEKHHELIKLRSKEKVRLENTKDQLKRMKKHKGGMCPILNESCDRISCTQKMLEEKEEAISTIDEKIELIEVKIDTVEAYYEMVDQVNSNTEAYNFLMNDIKATKVVGDTNKLEEQIQGLIASLDEQTYSNALEAVEEEQAKLSDLENKKGILNANLGGIKEKLANSKEAIDKIQKIEKQNEKFRKRLENLIYIQRMFSKSGIPAAEIENAFQEVEDDINFVLKELKSGLSVVFSPDKELNKWEEVCHCGFKFPKGYRKTECEECHSPRLKARKEELSLKILENGEESDFEGDSGGGKTIISYAVRIALTMLKRRQNRCKLNMLFLDEVDSALDAHLASTITNSITKLLTKKLGYDQIIMVSHKKEIQNAIPHIIKVTKYNDYSTAKFVA
jgi:DNA repair exonuclease SbcCD ATPase subunit